MIPKSCDFSDQIMRPKTRFLASVGTNEDDELTATRPFSLFEWMIAVRYLRARRAEGYVSVIAGFSFLGIMLGVATLIVVMSVMNGFHQELLDKIVGINGHIFLQAADAPLTDYEVVAQRASRVPGVELAIPMVEGAAFASSPFSQGGSGVLVRGVSGADIRRLPGIAGHVKSGTLEGFEASGGVAIGQRLADNLNLRVGDKLKIITASGPQTPFGVVPRVKAYPIVAIFQIGMAEFDSVFVYLPLPEAQAFFNKDKEVSVIELFLHDPEKLDAMRAAHRGGGAAAGDHDRLARAQSHLLRCAQCRAQCHVRHSDLDRARRCAQHHLGPHHAGEGQEPRHCDPAHHGSDARRDHADLSDHRRLDRHLRAHLPASCSGLSSPTMSSRSGRS